MSGFLQWGYTFVLEQWNEAIKIMDPRTENWFLMESPFIPVGIAGIYLALIFTLSPYYFHPNPMRIPFKTKEEKSMMAKLLQYYNLFNILMNLFIATGLTWLVIRCKYSMACEPVRIRTDDIYEDLTPIFIYLFHLSKVIELGDTAFIIVKGKTSQLSFLHVYHHTTIVFATWVAARVVPGGTTAILSLINCWIHVIMYSYYFSKSKGTGHQKNDQFFKRLLTIVQILQFVTTICICFMTLSYNCGYPSWVAMMVILYMFTFVLLFVHFYITTYN